MSFTISMAGIDKWKLLSSDWIDVVTTGNPAYTGGLYFNKLGFTSTAITTGNITAGATTTITSMTHGLVTGDFVAFSGTANESAYQTLVTAYAYYYVEKLTADTFNIKRATSTISTVDFEVLGCQPHLVDESDDVQYWAGGYRKIKKARIGFNIVLKAFKTRYDWNTTLQGNKNYWNLEKVLYSKSCYMFSFGSDFERIANLIALYTTDLKMPIKVEPMEFGELSAEFQNGLDRINITLVSTEWFSWT